MRILHFKFNLFVSSWKHLEELVLLFTVVELFSNSIQSILHFPDILMVLIHQRVNNNMYLILHWKIQQW